ncbi:MAG: hypothetical protein ABJC89_12260 [Acidobacteriota bacterium]
MVLLLLLVAVYGVNRRLHPTEREQAPAADATNSCHKPMSALCPNGKCEEYTYTQAVAGLRDLPCENSRVGTCGALRYVDYSDGFVSSTTFFDQSGSPVAARTTTDVVAPPCMGKMAFGAEDILSRYGFALEPDCRIVRNLCGTEGLSR